MQDITATKLKNSIRELICKDNFRNALKLLKRVSKNNPTDYNHAIFILFGECESLISKSLKGTISDEQEGLRSRQIKSKILRITELLSSIQSKFTITDNDSNKFFGTKISYNKRKKKNTVSGIISKMKSIFSALAILFFLVFLFSNWVEGSTENKLSHHTITMATYFDKKSALKGFDKIKVKLEEFGESPFILKDKIGNTYKVVVAGFKNKEEALKREKVFEQKFRNVVPTYSNDYYDTESLEFNGNFYEVIFKK